jgi:hypothetical protein
MQTSRNIASVDEIVDKLNLDREVVDEYDVDKVLQALDELESISMIERNVNINDDAVLFGARHGLKWSEFQHIDDPLKKTILLMLVENPKTFFVLQNTQSGKMRICALEINKWVERTDIKTVAFFITQNDKTLTDQSVEGLSKICKNCKLFTLSSNNKLSFDDIKSYIDAYSADTDGEYKMPVIAALANDIQNRKVLKLMAHILRKVRRNQSKLRYGIIFDEADDTYPKLRKMRIDVDGESMSYYQFIVDNDDALNRIGFVSATEGDLLDADFPECANAYLYQVDLEHSNNSNYRAAHHQESVFRVEKMTSKMSNNSYAEKLIDANLTYFTEPIEGTNYYRKIIVNSNARSSDMTSMAHFATSRGINAMVFNMYGVKTYISGAPVQTFRIRGRRFNELLFEIYKKLNMENKPLIIIGRRKVDRGLGFHYAPRDGSEGLIWTDIILGKIEDTNTAVQKAGRLAGIIAQCPQYYGRCTYWTDERTQRDILRHNNIVDEVNKLTGCTVLQAVTRGTVKVDENMPVEAPQVDVKKNVPIVLPMENAEIIRIHGLGTAPKRKALLTVLKGYLAANNKESLAARMDSFEVGQITRPDTENSRKKSIDDPFKAFVEGRPYSVNVKEAHKDKDSWQASFDDRENRVVFMIYCNP